MGTIRRLNDNEAAASYRFRGGGFRGVRLRERGFNGSSFIMPTLKGCFFPALLRTFAPSVGPLDEREMLLPVPDLPPPFALPLLAGLKTLTDWTKAWQFGQLVVLAGKSSRRNAAKHDVLVQSFMILFAIAIASLGKLLLRRYGLIGPEKRPFRTQRVPTHARNAALS
jgi:hypothetical protein